MILNTYSTMLMQRLDQDTDPTIICNLSIKRHIMNPNDHYNELRLYETVKSDYLKTDSGIQSITDLDIKNGLMLSPIHVVSSPRLDRYMALFFTRYCVEIGDNIAKLDNRDPCNIMH